MLGVVTGLFSIQAIRGLYVYQVHNGRIEWAAVFCAPGYEQFYDHETNTVASEWKLDCRYRISPWFDAGISDTPIDNPDSR